MIGKDRLSTKFPVVQLNDAVEFLDHLRRPVKESDRVPGRYPYFGANGQQGTINDFIFDEELVLLAEDGGHFGDPQKPIAYRVEGKCWVNNHAHVLRPKNGFDIKFLFRHLQYYDVSPFISGTTRGKLTKGAASQIPLSHPPLAEQKRIAAILDRADALRQKRRQSLQLCYEFLRATFLDMFGDPVNNNIDLVTLDRITHRITDGVHRKPDYVHEGIPFISVKNITTEKLDFSECKFISSGAHWEYVKRCKPEYLDILYTKVGATYGTAAIVDVKKEFSIYVSVALVKPNHNLVQPIYLREALNSWFVKRQADRLIKGIGVPDLHLVEIKKLEIPLPLYSAQIRFVQIVKQVEEAKLKLEVSGSGLDKQFASLVQRAFRGEL